MVLLPAPNVDSCLSDKFEGCIDGNILGLEPALVVSHELLKLIFGQPVMFGLRCCCNKAAAWAILHRPARDSHRLAGCTTLAQQRVEFTTHSCFWRFRMLKVVAF